MEVVPFVVVVVDGLRDCARRSLSVSNQLSDATTRRAVHVCDAVGHEPWHGSHTSRVTRFSRAALRLRGRARQLEDLNRSLTSVAATGTATAPTRVHSGHPRKR